VSLWGSLGDATVRLLDGRNYPVLATVNADGDPRGTVRVIVRVVVDKAAGYAA
jgi:hypothetical protein